MTIKRSFDGQAEEGISQQPVTSCLRLWKPIQQQRANRCPMDNFLSTQRLPEPCWDLPWVEDQKGKY